MKKEQARILFDKLDVSGTGFIDVNDYRRVLRGYADIAQIKKRIAKDDVDGDGRISFEEFYQSLQVVEYSEPQAFFRADGSVKWFDIFRYYDVDGSGYLEKDELRHFFVEKGTMTEAELDVLMNEMDSIERDGRISFAEMLLYHLKNEEK